MIRGVLILIGFIVVVLFGEFSGVIWFGRIWWKKVVLFFRCWC